MRILSEIELRVLGALVEKQIATPDYYPITLNALTNACNQKNQRDPVVSYNEADVTRAIGSLRGRQLAFLFEGAVARVPKFGHTFPKAYELDPPETAVLCVLMLRGPQTPGELRSRAGYLHNFASLVEVEETLQRLATRAEPFVLKLPRAPGMKESRYAHLLGGEVKIETPAPITTPESNPPAEPDRLAKLEAEVEKLKQEIDVLKKHFELRSS
jgi:uncharacterized protein